MSVGSKIVVAGFAIFAMVFGSGNIVFPLIVGKNFPIYWGWAAMGWILTGVIVHFVGDFSSILYDADNKKFLKPLGKYLAFALMLLIMLITGPFGAMARSVNVSYDCIASTFSGVNINVFNLLYCVLMTALAWNPGKLVELIGIIFTPLKFGGLMLVVLLGLYFKDPSIVVPATHTETVSQAFTQGANLGYQTMDMLTAFMCMNIIYGYIKKALPQSQQDDKKTLIKSSVYAFLVAGTVISIVYVGLIYLGAQYSPLLQNTADAALFTKIAELAIGQSAAWLTAIIIAVCCLGTNIALTCVFSNYLYETIFRKKISQKPLILLTGTITFIMSLLGFGKLCALLGQILTYVYPALIVFVVVRIIQYYSKR